MNEIEQAQHEAIEKLIKQGAIDPESEEVRAFQQKANMSNVTKIQISDKTPENKISDEQEENLFNQNQSVISLMTRFRGF